MKWFIDGDLVVITLDDFVNLQESPSVFVPVDSKTGKTIIHNGILGLPLGALQELKAALGKKRG